MNPAKSSSARGFTARRPQPPARRPLALAAALCAALLAGCITPPSAQPPAPQAENWNATLPHGGDAAQLANWWQRFDDPLLPSLVADAQATSPTLAIALARVRQARAGAQVAESAFYPSVDGSASIARQSDASTAFKPVTSAQVGAGALWEIDLFGGVRYSVDAAQARADQAGYGWHDARVSLAADVAQTYVGLRACEALAAVFQQDLDSQTKTAELTREKVRVGFEAPANGSLSDATAAQARDRLTGQRAECDRAVKTLVLLVGQPEPALRTRLAARNAALPQPAPFGIALPAQLLQQRPDIAAAERELVAAAADVGVAEAQRYPHITLSGNIGIGWVRLGGSTEDAKTWGFGPNLVLPLFDGGRRRAQVDASVARYDEARAAFEQRLRSAVAEVEEALVRLDAAQRREVDASLASQGFKDYYNASEARWRVGAGSLIDMEDARRLSLASQAVLVGVQRERVAAWISLYRAAGGGWTLDAAAPPLKVATNSQESAGR